jgi:hypothetical protein
MLFTIACFSKVSKSRAHPFECAINNLDPVPYEFGDSQSEFLFFYMPPG